MRPPSLSFALCLVAASCPQPTPDPPPPPPPPQVFLTVEDNNVIAPSVKGSLNTSGCASVRKLRVLNQGEAVLDTSYKGPNSPFELLPERLGKFFTKSGLALPLSLSATVVCDDDRTNTSAAVGVSFFPVANVLIPPADTQAVPDAFVAEGGKSGAPTTFLGCIGTAGGVALARVDTAGAIVGAVNEALPVPCSATSSFTDRHPTTQVRWLVEPGKGAFAFDAELRVTSSVTGDLTQLTMASDGDALVVMDTSTQPLVFRASARPAAATQNIVWIQRDVGGLVAAAPAIDVGRNHAWVAMWRYNLSDTADTVALRYRWDNGMPTQAQPTIVLRQTKSPQSPETLLPVAGAFNADGSLLYIPLPTSAGVGGGARSVVVACATNVDRCESASGGRRWTSAVFDSTLETVLPYGGGGTLAVAGADATWFLDATTGVARNLGDKAVTPSGSLMTIGLQPGSAADFYLLNGPRRSSGVLTFPTEIVGVDSADQGELWRVSYGGGNVPSGALWVAVDDGGQAWLRVGTRLVQPLTNAEYRALRGPTPSP